MTFKQCCVQYSPAILSAEMYAIDYQPWRIQNQSTLHNAENVHVMHVIHCRMIGGYVQSHQRAATATTSHERAAVATKRAAMAMASHQRAAMATTSHERAAMATKRAAMAMASHQCATMAAVSHERAAVATASRWYRVHGSFDV